jgi:hypothetical protein
MGNGVHPLRLHHVGRQTADLLSNPVAFDVSRANNHRVKANRRVNAALDRPVQDPSGNCRLSTEWSGGCLTVTSPAPRRLRRQPMRGREGDWPYPYVSGGNVNVIRSMQKLPLPEFNCRSSCKSKLPRPLLCSADVTQRLSSMVPAHIAEATLNSTVRRFDGVKSSVSLTP